MDKPALRFKTPNGQSFPKWTETRLGALFSFKNGMNASKEQYGRGTKFINVLDIINNDVIHYEDIIGKVETTQAELSNYDVIHGDILFQRSSETREEAGQSNVYIGREPVTFGGFVIRGRAIVKYDPIFMNYALKTENVRDEITKRSGGSTRYNVGQEALSTVPLKTPSVPEQKKIAAFLSTFDDKLKQLSKEMALLRDYKKGVARKIFSQETRFLADDGTDFPDWEHVELGDVTAWNSGGTPPKSNPAFWEGDIPWISASTMRGSKYSDSQLRITKAALSKSKLAKKGDLLLLVRGSMLFKKIPVGIATRDLAFNQDVKSIRAIGPTNPEFLLHWFLHSEGKILDMVSTTGIGAGKLDTKSLTEMDFSAPSLREQEKIADFLSAVDEKIENVERLWETAKRYKQGLLQQMFA